MTKEIPNEADVVLINKEALWADIQETFKIERLSRWLQQTKKCPGYHNQYVATAGKISLHPTTKQLKAMLLTKNHDYLIPDASWATMPGVGVDIPRGICQDAIFGAELMVYSRFVDLGMSDADLEEFYTHHCVESTALACQSFGLDTLIGVKVLDY